MSKDNKSKPAVLPDEEFNKKWDQENLYKNVKRMNDPRFGEITVVKNSSTNEVLFVKEKMASSKNEASNDIRELKSRIALNHPHLQKLVNYSTSVKKELCSTHYISRGFYEFPRSDLQKEGTERKRNLSSFNSSELTHLAYQGLGGLNHLHSRNITHGDVRPLNISYNKNDNQFQILDRLADPSPLEKLQGSNIVNKKELYMSPELWRKLQGKDKTLKYNAYKNDLYGLGLTILHLGTQDSVQDVYKPGGEFDQNKLDEHLNNFNGKYQNENPYLCTIVKTLLAPNEADRPESQQIFSNLIPYDQYKQQEAQGIRVGFNEQPQAHAQTTYQAQAQPQSQTNIQPASQTHIQQQQAGGFFDYQQPQETAVHSQPMQQEQKVIINKAEGQYSNANDTTQGYTNTSYTYPAGQNTHVYSQAPGNYSYQNETQYTYPTNTSQYVYSHQPSTYYTQTNPTYVQNSQTVTYSQDGTQLQQEPISYTYAQPNATFVNAQVEGGKEERKSYTQTYAAPIERRSYREYTVQPDGTKVERKSYTHYVVQDGTKIERKSYTNQPVTYTTTYTQPVTTYTQAPTTYTTYSQAPGGYTTYSQAPVTYTTYSQAPTETKIERRSYTYQTTPQTVTTYTTAPTETKIERKSYTYQTTPNTYTTYTYAQPTSQTTYIPYTGERKVSAVYTTPIINEGDRKPSESGTKVYSTPYEGERRVVYQGTAENQYSHTAYTEGTKTYVTYTNPIGQPNSTYVQAGQNVEVRRGSSIPAQNEVKVIKKRYIVQGDKVIEVDANEGDQQLQNEVQQHYQSNHQLQGEAQQHYQSNQQLQGEAQQNYQSNQQLYQPEHQQQEHHGNQEYQHAHQQYQSGQNQYEQQYQEVPQQHYQ